MIINSYRETVEQKNEFDANLAAYIVWRGAQFQRSKRLPIKPDELFKKKRKSSGSDWKQQKAAIEEFNLSIGGFDNRKVK